jgi:hypothetical protein
MTGTIGQTHLADAVPLTTLQRLVEQHLKSANVYCCVDPSPTGEELPLWV